MLYDFAFSYVPRGTYFIVHNILYPNTFLFNNYIKYAIHKYFLLSIFFISNEFIFFLHFSAKSYCLYDFALLYVPRGTICFVHNIFIFIYKFNHIPLFSTLFCYKLFSFVFIFLVFFAKSYKQYDFAYYMFHVKHFIVHNIHYLILLEYLIYYDIYIFLLSFIYFSAKSYIL